MPQNNVNTNTQAQHLLRLLMLSSTTLPVGAYCYSGGVESAINSNLISSEASAQSYFTDMVEMVLLRYELPMLAKLMTKAHLPKAFNTLALTYQANKESKELLLESQQMAYSLNAWIKDVVKLDISLNPKLGFVPVYAALASSLKLPIEQTLCAYGYTVIENQVLAAVKTVPLGQMAGQRLIWQLQQQLLNGIQNALKTAKQAALPSNSLPHLAILSTQHEQQYSRLFRS